MKSPFSVTVVRLPETLKMRLALFPLMARLAAPGPVIVRLLLTSNSPLARMIVDFEGKLKLIVSLLAAAAMVARREPTPASATEVTVSVLGRARVSSASKRRQYFG